MPVPIPLPKPPRRVRSSGGKGGLWFGRIFTLPHTLIGVGVTGYFLFMVLWALAGSDIPGVVTDTEITHSSKSGDHYYLKYQYQAGAETKAGSGGVSEGVYERFKSRELTNVTVRYFSLGPMDHAELDESKKHWGGVGMLLLWVTFWDLAVSLAVFQLWIKPIRRRLLYKHGEVAAGKVVSKRVRTGKSNSYYISYVFTDPATGISLTAETEVGDEATWNRAATGESVTVLYAANKPKHSTLYEYGGYYCVDFGGVI